MVTSCLTEIAYTSEKYCVLNDSEQYQTSSDALYKFCFLPNIFRMMKWRHMHWLVTHTHRKKTMCPKFMWWPWERMHGKCRHTWQKVSKQNLGALMLKMWNWLNWCMLSLMGLVTLVMKFGCYITITLSGDCTVELSFYKNDCFRSNLRPMETSRALCMVYPYPHHMSPRIICNKRGFRHRVQVPPMCMTSLTCSGRWQRNCGKNSLRSGQQVGRMF